MIFYTKNGDNGKSKIGNNKISKDSLILEVLGELDELNSLIGLVKNIVRKYKKQLHQIQEDLFIIQAQIAWFMYPKFKKPIIKEEKILKFEQEINKIEKKNKPPKKLYNSRKRNKFSMAPLFKSSNKKSRKKNY